MVDLKIAAYILKQPSAKPAFMANFRYDAHHSNSLSVKAT